jgi:hypothetical protein
VDLKTGPQRQTKRRQGQPQAQEFVVVLERDVATDARQLSHLHGVPGGETQPDIERRQAHGAALGLPMRSRLE